MNCILISTIAVFLWTSTSATMQTELSCVDTCVAALQENGLECPDDCCQQQCNAGQSGMEAYSSCSPIKQLCGKTCCKVLEKMGKPCCLDCCRKNCLLCDQFFENICFMFAAGGCQESPQICGEVQIGK